MLWIPTHFEKLNETKELDNTEEVGEMDITIEQIKEQVFYNSERFR